MRGTVKKDSSRTIRLPGEPQSFAGGIPDTLRLLLLVGLCKVQIIRLT